MRKAKIYLDTSVISHLLHEDAPEKMADTQKFWRDIKNGCYNVFISRITIEEIERCPEPKQTKMLEYIADIEYTLIEHSLEIEELAAKIIERGILTEKSRDDCQHISAAVINDCDMIVSWNFKHMVNIKTINGVRAINLLNGYRSIDIYAPSTMIRSDDDE